MNTIFYLFAFLFVINNIYFISNKKRLQSRFVNKTILLKKDMFYYALSVIFILWIFIGIFSSYYKWFYVLLAISALRFPIYHLSKKLYKVYEYILPYLNILVLLSLINYVFFN